MIYPVVIGLPPPESFLASIILLYHKSVNEARRFPALVDIRVKKSGSNLGQTSFAIVFSKAQVRKKEISFAVFLSSKVDFSEETPIFNRPIIQTI